MGSGRHTTRSAQHWQNAPAYPVVTITSAVLHPPRVSFPAAYSLVLLGDLGELIIHLLPQLTQSLQFDQFQLQFPTPQLRQRILGQRSTVLGDSSSPSAFHACRPTGNLSPCWANSRATAIRSPRLPRLGAAADGQPRPWEDGPPLAEHPGLAEHDQNIIEAAVAKAIEQYEQQRGRGSVPGGLARAAADLLHPNVDPARELLAKVKYAVGCTSGFGDFTYRKPNRRQPAGGAMLPAHVKPIPRVTVIADTSGASDAARKGLSLALGVTANALRSLPDPRGLRVLAGDTAVACAKNVFRPEQVELNGGGGTDMAAMIEAACEERPAPKAILVVTDGFTGWPSEPVVPRVVACLTRASQAASVPTWINTVVLNPEELSVTERMARPAILPASTVCQRASTLFTREFLRSAAENACRQASCQAVGPLRKLRFSRPVLIRKHNRPMGVQGRYAQIDFVSSGRTILRQVLDEKSREA